MRYGFGHVINGQACHAYSRQGLHLNARLVRDFDRSADSYAVKIVIIVKAQTYLSEWQARSKSVGVLKLVKYCQLFGKNTACK